MGAGPRILVLMGRQAMLPTWRTSGTSLNEEWYAYGGSDIDASSPLVGLTGMAVVNCDGGRDKDCRGGERQDMRDATRIDHDARASPAYCHQATKTQLFGGESNPALPRI